MSDKGIKNVIVKKELLGKVTSSNSRVVRFRIVSEDKNRKSAWSKIFITGSEAFVAGPGVVNALGNPILVNWSTSQTSVQIPYDVFIGFDGSGPEYVETALSKSYSFIKTGTESVRVVIQISSINPRLSDSLEVYDSGTVSLV
jgi:hypothetical protein